MKNIIKKVLVSEKSFQDATDGKYTFVVEKSANKDLIARLCEELFKVTVLAVNTSNYSGKIKMTKKGRGKREDFKKATITVKKGDKIDLFEIEEDKEKKKDKK